MADDRRKKIQAQRQKIASLKQRAKAMLIVHSRRRRDQALRMLEILADLEGKIAERNLYEERGSQELADKFNLKIDKGLDETEKDLQDTEQMIDTGEDDEDEEGDQQAEQPEEQLDDLDNLDRNQRRGDQRTRRPREPKPQQKPATRKPVTPKASVPKTPVAGGGAAGGRATLAVVTKSPYFWIVIGIVLVLILIVVLFIWLAGGTHKAFNETGGSLPITMDYNKEADRALAGEVMQLRNSGMIVLAPDIAKDIEWQDSDSGKPAIKLDKRVMVTLKYLGNLWAKRTNGMIRVRVAASNGPDFTRRSAVLKLAGLALGGKENKEEALDAPSAYVTGQAIAIDTVGRISNELADACFDDHDQNQDNNAFVEVGWQEIVSQEIIRPTYEQLQIDGKLVYEGYKVLQGLAEQAKKDTSLQAEYTAALAKDSWYTRVGDTLDKMIINLDKMAGLDKKGIDDRTKEYASTAAMALTGARSRTRGDILAWGDDAVIQQLRDGLQTTFRMMQVANMTGWRKPDKCQLWKAYEARQNIRQLVLDIEKMPADKSLVEAGQNWNADFMARQVIVYSPEDDLDNGLSDMDIFPMGADSVDTGGVGFDDTGRDGLADMKDNHFMSMPVDGGVFSKASTIWVYKTKGAWDNFQQYAKDYGQLSLDITQPSLAVLGDMFKIMSGAGGSTTPETGTSLMSGERLQGVTYKDFVHIGF